MERSYRVVKWGMRNELLSWFAREGLLLSYVAMASDDPDDELKISFKAPMIALSRASHDFRECPDPVLFGYPESSLDFMTLDDMHYFVLSWFEKAIAAGMARCFVCNQKLYNADPQEDQEERGSQQTQAEQEAQGAEAGRGGRENGTGAIEKPIASANRPWDAVFISTELYCWLVVHFDCKRYLNRDLKGRNPFEVATQPPEFFDMQL